MRIQVIDETLIWNCINSGKKRTLASRWNLCTTVLLPNLRSHSWRGQSSSCHVTLILMFREWTSLHLPGVDNIQETVSCKFDTLVNWQAVPCSPNLVRSVMLYCWYPSDLNIPVISIVSYSSIPDDSWNWLPYLSMLHSS